MHTATDSTWARLSGLRRESEELAWLASSLSLKGMSNGAIIAFLITATSISPPELIMLSAMFKRKYIVTFVVAMIIAAIITGYVVSLIH
jgi:uncharacterized membrane protein YraQ (UPF0718 family)